MAYEGQLAEMVRIWGHTGDEIDAYYARPLGAGPIPGVVVLHHAPGFDEWCREVTRKLAHHGYAALMPNLHYRQGPGSVDDLAAAVRAAGGVPDDQCLGDVEGAVRFLKAQPYANGRVGVIGFCSGGRQSYLVACRVKGFAAAVDCWGGRVVGRDSRASEIQPVAPIDYTMDLGCPLLGIFGNDDRSPSPDDVNETEAILKKHGKTYELHRYDGAGHAFFDTFRPSHRPEQAVDAWNHIWDFYAKYLKG